MRCSGSWSEQFDQHRAIGPYTMVTKITRMNSNPIQRRNLRTEDIERVRHLHDACIAGLRIAGRGNAVATAGLPAFASVWARPCR